jgi:hypothetical protein
MFSWTEGVSHFILHTSPFQPVVQGDIVYRKKPHLVPYAKTFTHHIGCSDTNYEY